MTDNRERLKAYIDCLDEGSVLFLLSLVEALEYGFGRVNFIIRKHKITTVELTKTQTIDNQAIKL